MAAEAKAQTELQDFKSLFSLEGKVVVVVCTPSSPTFLSQTRMIPLSALKTCTGRRSSFCATLIYIANPDKETRLTPETA